MSATRDLTHTGNVLGNLLANDNDVTDRLTGAALQASAYSAKPTLTLAADQVRALDATTRAADGPGAGHRHRLRHALRAAPAR